MRDPVSKKVATVPEDDSIELSSRAHTQGLKKKNHYLTVRWFKKLKCCNITFYCVTSKHYLKTKNVSTNSDSDYTEQGLGDKREQKDSRLILS